MLCVQIAVCLRIPTDLDQDTYETTGNHKQSNVLCEPGGPQGPVLDADGTQHLFEPHLLLQDEALDVHAHGVDEGQNQHHGQHAAKAQDEAEQFPEKKVSGAEENISSLCVTHTARALKSGTLKFKRESSLPLEKSSKQLFAQEQQKHNLE